MTGRVLGKPQTRGAAAKAVRTTWLVDLVALAGLYVTGGVLGFGIFAMLFKIGIASGIGVLFFRGLLLAGLAFVLTFGLLLLAVVNRCLPTLRPRDTFSAAVLSLSFNVCFLVVVPVTVDRSISVFILGEMNADPAHLYSPDEMSALFTKVYVGDYRQIDRRMREQTLTGNVEDVGARYKISARGQRFIAVSRWVVSVFGGDAKLANPPASPAGSAPH